MEYSIFVLKDEYFLTRINILLLLPFLRFSSGVRTTALTRLLSAPGQGMRPSLRVFLWHGRLSKVVRVLSAYPSALLQLCFLYAFFNGRSGVVGASCVPCVCIAIAVNDAATLGNVCFRAAPPLALLTVLVCLRRDSLGSAEAGEKSELPTFKDSICMMKVSPLWFMEVSLFCPSSEGALRALPAVFLRFPSQGGNSGHPRHRRTFVFLSLLC